MQEDLEHSLDVRPARLATIIGVRSSKLYIELEGFSVELKLYTWDLESQYHCQFQRDGITLKAENADLSFSLGDAIKIKTKEFNERRNRWSFFVEPASAI